MGQQGSRPDVNAVTELPAAGGRPRVDLELKEVTDVDVAVATSSQSGKLKREVGRPPSSHERGTDRLPPAKPVSPSGVRPPSQGPTLSYRCQRDALMPCGHGDSPRQPGI